MSTDRDPSRIVRSWLEDGATQLPDRVLDAVVADLPATPQRRADWLARRFGKMSMSARLATAAAALAVLAVVGVTIILGGNGVGVERTATPSPTANPAGTTPSTAASPSGDTAVSVPGEFTACVPNNSIVREGTSEEASVPHPDGDMTLHRERGSTYAGNITATDPRFSGRHYYSWDGNLYTLASGGDGFGISADSHRIENDDGAWTGTGTYADLPDGTQAGSPVFLTGEGAYEGLTAVLIGTDGSCFFDFRGFILEFPDPPAPYTPE